MKKTEICLHCNDDFVPTRRGIQKFCTNSCRSRYWQLKQAKLMISKVKESQKKDFPEVKNQSKKDTLSLAGVGNAAAGVAVVEVAKNLFTPAENKPATKKDIQEIKSLLAGARYLPVKNINNDIIGRKPFYDIESGYVIYL